MARNQNGEFTGNWAIEWAKTGDKENPTFPIATGYDASYNLDKYPTREVYNQVRNKITSALIDLDRYGIYPYSDRIKYKENAVVLNLQDGELYSSNANDNLGNDLTNTTYWETYIDKITPIAITNGGTGGVTATEARNNLGCGSAAVRNIGNNIGEVALSGNIDSAIIYNNTNITIPANSSSVIHTFFIENNKSCILDIQLGFLGINLYEGLQAFIYKSISRDTGNTIITNKGLDNYETASLNFYDYTAAWRGNIDLSMTNTTGVALSISCSILKTFIKAA